MSRACLPVVEQPSQVEIMDDKKVNDTYHSSVVEDASDKLKEGDILRTTDKTKQNKKSIGTIKENLDENDHLIVKFSKEAETRAKQNKRKKPYWILVIYFVLSLLLTIGILSSPAWSINPKSIFWCLIALGFFIAGFTFLRIYLKNVGVTSLFSQIERRNASRVTLTPVSGIFYVKKQREINYPST